MAETKTSLKSKYRLTKNESFGALGQKRWVTWYPWAQMAMSWAHPCLGPRFRPGSGASVIILLTINLLLQASQPPGI